MGIVNLKKIIVSAILISLPFQASAAKPLSTAADLRYGVALYHYYQGHYMDALTELLVAEKRGGIKGHGDNPEIMEGGFSLGYGMERHASEIFERLLKENRPLKVRDAAWFYLSKLRYLRQDWNGAKDALDRISRSPAKEIYNEVIAHRVNLAIRQNRLDDAASLLRKQKDKRGWLPYLHYNLGSAYARNQEYETAIQYFEHLKIKEKLKAEHKALYDQAMTAAGYCAVFLKDYNRAIDYFSRVRLTSALSNRALLGYGWAAAELEQYEEALKPWLYLSEKSLLDENALEAMVAVPFAYEKLGSDGLALQHFKTAEQKYNEEIARLDEVIELMDGDTMLQALRIEGSSGLDWLKYAEENKLEPKLSYLADLFAKEAFQSFVQELRDLIAIKNNLINWQKKLEFYDETIANRQRYRNSKEEVLNAGEMTDEMKKLRRYRNYLAKKIDDVVTNEDYFALASEEESELIDRVIRVKKNIELLRETDPFIDESEEMARWYYGLLMWESSENYSDRRWKAQKSLIQLDDVLRDARKNHTNVQDIIKNAPDLDPKQELVIEYRIRLQNQLAEVEEAIANAQFDLSTNIIAILQEQRRKLNIYLGQSRLSIARLYDKANPEVWEAEIEDEPVDETEQPADENSEQEPVPPAESDAPVEEQNSQEVEA